MSKLYSPNTLLNPIIKIWNDNNTYKSAGKQQPKQLILYDKEIPENIIKPEYGITGIPYKEKIKRTHIEIKSYKEIKKIRNLCKRASNLHSEIAAFTRENVTCHDIDEFFYNRCIEEKVYPSCYNYYKFPKACCTSVNDVVCHGIPDMYKLQNSDIINVDITIFDKFHADMSKTFIIGETDGETKKLVDTCKEALDASIKICKPGMPYKMIGILIGKIARDNGFSVVTDFFGHGIGKLFHTIPFIFHHINNDTEGIMEPGHVFTIEPMLNIGTPNTNVWPDNWTAVTNDGKNSAQFEHTILITNSGAEILTE